MCANCWLADKITSFSLLDMRIDGFMIEDIDFSNRNVCLSSFGKRGRGLVARNDIKSSDLIVSSPVKLLNRLEYEALRFIPSIISYQKKSPVEDDNGMVILKSGIDKLFENPDEVLKSTGENESAQSTIMYTFTWPREEAEGGDTAAIVFGLTSMCNHAPSLNLANAKIVRNYKHEYIDLVATTAIKKGNEILINYVSTPFHAV